MNQVIGCPWNRRSNAVEFALAGVGMAVQGRVVDVERRAIGADGFRALAHVDENVRMVEGRQGADAHEAMRADFHARQAGLIVEVRRGVVSHIRIPLEPPKA